MEATPTRSVVGIWYEAFDGRQLASPSRAQIGNRSEQRLRIGVERPIKNVVHRASLDDLSKVHDDYIVGKFRDHPQIMGDERDGHSVLSLQRVQQIENLGLRRDIERCRGFIGNENARVACKSHRDHGTLPKSTRELEAVLSKDFPRPRYIDISQERGRDIRRFARVEPGPVEPEDLNELASDRVYGAERRHGFLEHVGDLAPADGPHHRPILVKVDQVDRPRRVVGSSEKDLPFYNATLSLDDSQYRTRSDAFPAPAFPDDPQRPANLEIEVDLFHRLDDAFVGIEVGLQSPY